jgi:hypothetical protein
MLHEKSNTHLENLTLVLQAEPRIIHQNRHRWDRRRRRKILYFRVTRYKAVKAAWWLRLGVMSAHSVPRVGYVRSQIRGLTEYTKIPLGLADLNATDWLL